MGKRKGWIKLYGSIRESAVWSDPLRLKAWIDILLSANYQDDEWFEHGQLHKVKRGQFVTSIRKLGKAWGCAPNTVRRILKQFTELGMIEHNSDTLRYTLLTVVKYGDFQSAKVLHEYSDEYSDEYTDEYTEGYNNEYSNEYSDGIQVRNIKNNIDVQENKEPTPAPDGGADGYGDAPPEWSDWWEKDFMDNIADNPGMTRSAWYDFVKPILERQSREKDSEDEAE